ncbi:sel1 repeat family protein [Clostridium sp. DSM 100503]|uniref:tetratricopeptide repeat protein n=1 Tax=Clostridium sp. DSM 100503 TaxID=2963282 RepID=UPI00214A0FAB|nr:tetratricopeptide repeat protein [Clostridium sp. DSM 100503]MCR1950592.1 sel1 repeat family protein [Clostridium sp. DSM 100503]
MKLKFDFNFLLLEFRDLYYILNKIGEEKDYKIVCSKLVKIINQIIITIHLNNKLFYNSENSLVENIEYLSRKDIIPYELMKCLVNYVEDLYYIKDILDDDDVSMNKKKEFAELLNDQKVIYETCVWLVINCGEEDYSLFYDKLADYEKKIFDKYLNYDELDEDNDEIDLLNSVNEVEYEEDDDDEINSVEEYLLAGEMYYLGKDVEKDYYKAKEYFEKAAEEGSEYAESYLGLFWEKGYGCEKDIEKALYWYKKAALKRNAFAQYSLGYMYFIGEEVEKNLEYSFKWYREAAENGFAPAQYALSYLYKNGEGCEKSVFKAYYWLEESAENDFEDSYYILGQSYLEGNAIETNYKKAFFYLSKGVEKDDMNCLESLGDMYYWGLYVDEDREKAFSLYDKSIEAGNISLYYKLGKLYEEDNNIKMALVNYLKGHGNGDLKSTQRLGIMYYNGDGVEIDKKKALTYMKAAIEGEDPHSLYVIGVAYLNDNREKGLEYLKKAYEKGSYYAAEALASEYLIDLLNDKEINEDELLEYINYAMENEMVEAIYYYGLLHVYGFGVEKNNEEAFKYFIKAAEKGSQKAMLKLGNWYKHGIFVKANSKEAIEWYKKAAEEYNTEALLNIIEIHEKGIGIEKDYKKALEGAYLLREINIVEGNLKLAYYYSKGIGVEISNSKANEYIEELLILDEAKAYNLLGELAEEKLFNKREEDAIEYYLKAISLGEAKAYSNLEYYLYIRGRKIDEFDNLIDSVDKKSYSFEQAKSIFVEGKNEILKGKNEKNSELIKDGIKKLKKSTRLGFYDAIKDIIDYYENEEKTKDNLIELYKYKHKMVYYGINI